MGKKKVSVPSEPQGYENSHHDFMEDYSTARRRGISVEDHEDSARDRIADKAGEKHLRDKSNAKAAIKNEPSYKAGQSAFANRPKTSHGFGHTGAQRQGHLRNSGHSGAHQIGKKR
jgi:hypothetical protein